MKESTGILQEVLQDERNIIKMSKTYPMKQDGHCES